MYYNRYILTVGPWPEDQLSSYTQVPTTGFNLESWPRAGSDKTADR